VLQVAPVRRDIQMFQPPGPPLRSVDPHSNIAPSGLAASRISVSSLDTIPGATSSAADAIAKLAGPVAGAGLEPDEVALPHATQASQTDRRMTRERSVIRGRIGAAAASAAVRDCASTSPIVFIGCLIILVKY
jgi:hypothetical protein